MKVLGIYAMGPNTAACLVVDGELIAFAEEERFTRVKLASNTIPTRSSNFCLKQGGLTLADVDVISLGWDNTKYPKFMQEFYREAMNHPAKDDYSQVYELISLNEKDPIYFNKKLEIAYRRGGYFDKKFPPLKYENHHAAHAYSVFYPSPFEKSLIMVVDGSGEEMATSFWMGEGDKITFLEGIKLPHSLGFFYAALTEYLGFSVFTGEGKVMGLAPYGTPDKKIARALDEVIRIDGDGYKVNAEYIYFAKRSTSLRHTDKLTELLGQPPRVPESPYTDWYRSLAWEVQDKLEKIVQYLVTRAIKKYGVNDLCIAGGVAMNCKMNGFVANMPEVKNCFVIPASTDAGCAYGSALMNSLSVKDIRAKARKMTPYSGPQFSDDAIQALVDESKLGNYVRFSDDELFDQAAELLAQGKIVAWFQGRMEVGARALGNRSILANPGIADMKDKINREVKHREAFRPFAPSILAEHAHEIFAIKPGQSYEPFHSCMLQAAQALPGVAKLYPAVVHVDNSIRPQIVSKQSNARYYRLIKTFHAKTGVPMVLNTSFNVRGEPIICKPDEALRCFYSNGLDALVMGNFIFRK